MSDGTKMTQVGASAGEVTQVTENHAKTAPLGARAHGVRVSVSFASLSSLPKENQIVRSDDKENLQSLSVTEVTESKIPEQIQEPYDHRAGVLRALAGYSDRLRSEKPADKRWREDEQAKAEMAAKPKRQKRTTLPYEREEQATLVKWLKSRGIDYNANLEGVARHFRARLAAKHAGMRRGRPDIEILTPVPGRPEIRGVAVEVKRQQGSGARPSEFQVERLEDYREAGWLAEVHYGAASAIRWLAGLYGVRP
jgi:hypothetical protein